ncbi:MBL fold metallo-hydrolase [Glutamicibacter sp. MNS18]|uniref:MBL fold metallo-hydrolase n=1 Tax=Glutamicibacter sp. MNS18 TaxID=2989817 RepID=UPI00223600F9|nr:MBL fold metallo-hydrolase [Glutamicibacter sp. MNS18]MCW4467171.1 MBL fold metallo-hydrolase [Glutamicibacter sp. MNS18]
MEHLASPRWLGPGLGLLRANNPSEMTLQGTNSYLVFDPALDEPAGTSPVIVIDPGPELEDHLQALARFEVCLVLATHRHADHTGGINRIHELTGAPVRALLPAHCRDAAPLLDGELIQAAGTSLQVLHTPGHTSDSVCLLRQGACTNLFTGDTVLGSGTTILEHPDGTLADYLASLRMLRAVPDTPLHPGHGPQHPGSHRLLDDYLAHREQRLGQVRGALARLGKTAAQAAPAELLGQVYPDIDARLAAAATHSLQAQLHYLESNA